MSCLTRIFPTGKQDTWKFPPGTVRSEAQVASPGRLRCLLAFFLFVLYGANEHTIPLMVSDRYELRFSGLIIRSRN